MKMVKDGAPSDRRVYLLAGLLILSAGFFLLVTLALVPRPVIHRALVFILPRSLFVALLLTWFTALVAAWRVREGLRRNARFLAGACAVALLGVAAALFFTPRTHRLYFDEDIYVQIGQSMARDGKAGMLECSVPPPAGGPGWKGLVYKLNKEPAGFSFAVALATVVAGVRDDAGMIANLALFALGIAGLAFLARESGLFRPAAVFTAPILYALWPENLRWSVCGVAEVGAASAAIWALALGLRASRTRDRVEALLALLAAAFACQFRPEGVLVLLPFAIAAGDANLRGESRTARALSGAAVLAVLLLPHLVHLGSVSGEGWGTTGPKFRMDLVSIHLEQNLGWWFTRERVGNTEPAVHAVTWIAAAGLVLLVARTARAWFDRSPMRVVLLRSSLTVLSWLALFFGIFIPFYAGSYYYGVDVRFSVLISAPVMLLAAYALHETLGAAVSLLSPGPRLRALSLAAAPVIGSALLLPHLIILPVITREAQQARQDHAAVKTFIGVLPPNAVVVTHTPALWAVQNRAAVQVQWALAHPEAMEVLARNYMLFYHWNYWDIGGGGQETIASGEEFLARYDHEVVATVEAEGKWVFKLHSLRTRPVIEIEAPALPGKTAV